MKAGAGLFEKVKSSGLRMQFSNIDRALEQKRAQTRRLPRDFAAFMRAEFSQGGDAERDPAKDPWGTFYRFQKTKTGFEIMSAGPDEKMGNEDDLVWRRAGDDAGLINDPDELARVPRKAKAVVVKTPAKQEGIDKIWMALLEQEQAKLRLDDSAINEHLETFLELTVFE